MIRSQNGPTNLTPQRHITDLIMLPFELVEVVEYLNSIEIEISKKRDGRLASADDETTVFDLLVEKFGPENIVREPQARWWWDYQVFGYYVNFKSSTYASADNFSSKGALLYALTDLETKYIDEMNSCRWKKFQQQLKDNSGKENNRDYYIITLNKNTNDCHLSSLKTLNKLTSNGNNLPFQIDWKDNLSPIERDYLQSYDFLVGCYKESVRKKVSAHDGFEQL